MRLSRLSIAITALVLLTSPIFAQAPDPAREAQRAQELVAAGKFDEPIRIYHDLIRADPSNPALLLNLCVAEYKAKHYREAITAATGALQLQPDLLPARLFLGASQLEVGEFTAAIDSLRLVAAANPRERNGRLMLGEAFLGAGQSAAALEHLQAAAEMLPDSPRVWYALGRAQESLGQISAAKESWERLMALPVSLERHLHLAEVHNSAQRWREAAIEWREALRLAPEKSAIRLGLGEALFRSRDYHAAMAVLDPLRTSDNATAQFLYGASLLNLQKPADAIPYLKAPLARDPQLAPARAALGQALLQTGHAEEAIPLLADAISADPDGSIHFQLYRAYQLTHREAEAREALADYQRFRASLAAQR